MYFPPPPPKKKKERKKEKRKKRKNVFKNEEKGMGEKRERERQTDRQTETDRHREDSCFYQCLPEHYNATAIAGDRGKIYRLMKGHPERRQGQGRCRVKGVQVAPPGILFLCCLTSRVA